MAVVIDSVNVCEGDWFDVRAWGVRIVGRERREVALGVRGS